MNSCYRVIWSARHRQWVVASEITAGRGRGASILVSLAVSLPLAVHAADISKGLTGFNPREGQVQFLQGNTPSEAVLKQVTDKAIIDWQGFSLPQGTSLQFVQPGASSMALNRVTGPQASALDGTLTGNGQVWLINPNGVLIGSQGRINVHGFLASTLALSNDDFMQGRYQFNATSSAQGGVFNNGVIQTLPSGYAVLAGHQVENSGLIQAYLGKVALGAAEQVTLSLSGDGLLGFAVDQSLTPSASGNATGILNSGVIRASGGQVILSARVLTDMMQSVINTTGLLEANSVGVQNGEIILQGGDAGLVSVTGSLDAKGVEVGETGGAVKVTGNTLFLSREAKIDASGDSGGGLVYLGGGWQGDIVDGQSSAVRVGISSQTLVDASATRKGDGGTIVAWSDIKDPDSQTHAYGSFLAKGGVEGGNGGRVETSGYWLGINGAQVSTAAPKGVSGLWLLDPDDIYINDSGGVPPNGSFDPSYSGLSSPTNISWVTSGANSAITVNEINQVLNSSNVSQLVISTGLDSTVPAVGNITLNLSPSLPINIPAGGQLKLIANNNVLGSASISGPNASDSGVGTFVIEQGGNSNVALDLSGNLTLSTPGSGTLALSGNVSGYLQLASNLTVSSSGLNALPGVTIDLAGKSIDGSGVLSLSGIGMPNLSPSLGNKGALINSNSSDSSVGVPLSLLPAMQNDPVVAIGGTGNILLTGNVGLSGQGQVLKKIGSGELTLDSTLAAGVGLSEIHVSEGSLFIPRVEVFPSVDPAQIHVKPDQGVITAPLLKLTFNQNATLPNDLFLADANLATTAVSNGSISFLGNQGVVLEGNVGISASANTSIVLGSDTAPVFLSSDVVIDLSGKLKIPRVEGLKREEGTGNWTLVQNADQTFKVQFDAGSVLGFSNASVFSNQTIPASTPLFLKSNIAGQIDGFLSLTSLAVADGTQSVPLFVGPPDEGGHFDYLFNAASASEIRTLSFISQASGLTVTSAAGATASLELSNVNTKFLDIGANVSTRIAGNQSHISTLGNQSYQSGVSISNGGTINCANMSTIGFCGEATPLNATSFESFQGTITFQKALFDDLSSAGPSIVEVKARADTGSGGAIEFFGNIGLNTSGAAAPLGGLFLKAANVSWPSSASVGVGQQINLDEQVANAGHNNFELYAKDTILIGRPLDIETGGGALLILGDINLGGDLKLSTSGGSLGIQTNLTSLSSGLNVTASLAGGNLATAANLGSNSTPLGQVSITGGGLYQPPADANITNATVNVFAASLVTNISSDANSPGVYWNGSLVNTTSSSTNTTTNTTSSTNTTASSTNTTAPTSNTTNVPPTSPVASEPATTAETTTTATSTAGTSSLDQQTAAAATKLSGDLGVPLETVVDLLNEGVQLNTIEVLSTIATLTGVGDLKETLETVTDEALKATKSFAAASIAVTVPLVPDTPVVTSPVATAVPPNNVEPVATAPVNVSTTDVPTAADGATNPPPDAQGPASADGATATASPDAANADSAQPAGDSPAAGEPAATEPANGESSASASPTASTVAPEPGAPPPTQEPQPPQSEPQSPPPATADAGPGPTTGSQAPAVAPTPEAAPTPAPAAPPPPEAVVAAPPPPPPPPVAPPPPSPVPTAKPPTPVDTADAGDKTLASVAPPEPPKPAEQPQRAPVKTVSVVPGGVVNVQVPVPPRPPATSGLTQKLPSVGNSARW